MVQDFAEALYGRGVSGRAGEDGALVDKADADQRGAESQEGEGSQRALEAREIEDEHLERRQR